MRAPLHCFPLFLPLDSDRIINCAGTAFYRAQSSPLLPSSPLARFVTAIAVARSVGQPRSDSQPQQHFVSERPRDGVGRREWTE